ncbi:PA0069 family radical SAM protein [Aliifodinibius sp. S!AR15-10]|uniref:PA0069 family radical SAM protein n=1 Tax=Aliifodinibius sp. S!AR15-10 TaxID=2950437 RepID=UPI002859DBB3|nr:PA0069 family radical SAM protein [Aliifodinibius sp. S!AR15-10]MDR8393543.1 PA0069 family radical SAM protein [Aliifodinibius sp. S!AR15-10]
MSEQEKGINPIKGRGSSDNPANRFEEFYTDYDLDEETGQKPSQQTKLYRDDTKEIISTNDSPDIPFDKSINPYRGCEHGCIYCYARPTHEYLGFSAGLDFESRIMVKHDAPRKLREQLASPKWDPTVLVMSGVTDPYQPVERKLEITRGCLEVMAEFLNPVSIITKNYLVTRDIDHLKELAEHNAAHVTLSVTTLDKELAQKMEPRTSRPGRRLQAIEELAKAGISVGVNVAPIIPGLTEHEVANILEAAANAGAAHAGYTLLRLPFGVKELFQDWLEQHFPDRKDKVLNRIRDIRDGKLNDPEFGSRMRGHGNFAKQISDLFKVHTKRFGLNKEVLNLSTQNFRAGGGSQLKLF